MDAICRGDALLESKADVGGLHLNWGVVVIRAPTWVPENARKKADVPNS
jgi:hypothetical protein